MITRTSFNKQLLDKIVEAMKTAAYNSLLWSAACRRTIKGTAYVQNARGEMILRVDHRRGEPGAICVYDRHHRDVTAMFLAALRKAG